MAPTIVPGNIRKRGNSYPVVKYLIWLAQFVFIANLQIVRISVALGRKFGLTRFLI